MQRSAVVVVIGGKTIASSIQRGMSWRKKRIFIFRESNVGVCSKHAENVKQNVRGNVSKREIRRNSRKWKIRREKSETYRRWCNIKSSLEGIACYPFCRTRDGTLSRLWNVLESFIGYPEWFSEDLFIDFHHPHELQLKLGWFTAFILFFSAVDSRAHFSSFIIE